MPKFSVISPVYNTAPFLDRFIRSMQAQTYGDFELILIDDGSKDDSLSICERYAADDCRIKVHTQPNSGAGAARNNGISKAEGEFLLFYDSDDWVDETALAVLEALLNKTNVDLLVYGAQEIRITGDKEEKHGERIPPAAACQTAADCRKQYHGLVSSAVLNPPWNKVYRNSLIKKNNLSFPDTRRSQDALFNMAYFRCINSMYSIQDALYYYRENDQKKVWMKFPQNIWEIDILYNTTLEQDYRDYGIYEGAAREYIDRWFYMAILRDASFCRNPRWNFSGKQKHDYINQILEAPYNQQRAETAVAQTKLTQGIRECILTKNSKRLMRLFYKDYYWNSFYDFYCRKIKRRS